MNPWHTIDVHATYRQAELLRAVKQRQHLAAAVLDRRPSQWLSVFTVALSTISSLYRS
jgi:hypothetical protein